MAHRLAPERGRGTRRTCVPGRQPSASHTAPPCQGLRPRPQRKRGRWHWTIARKPSKSGTIMDDGPCFVCWGPGRVANELGAFVTVAGLGDPTVVRGPTGAQIHVTLQDQKWSGSGRTVCPDPGIQITCADADAGTVAGVRDRAARTGHQAATPAIACHQARQPPEKIMNEFNGTY